MFLLVPESRSSPPDMSVKALSTKYNYAAIPVISSLHPSLAGGKRYLAYPKTRLEILSIEPPEPSGFLVKTSEIKPNQS